MQKDLQFMRLRRSIRLPLYLKPHIRRYGRIPMLLFSKIGKNLITHYKCRPRAHLRACVHACVRASVRTRTIGTRKPFTELTKFHEEKQHSESDTEGSAALRFAYQNKREREYLNSKSLYPPPHFFLCPLFKYCTVRQNECTGCGR